MESSTSEAWTNSSDWTRVNFSPVGWRSDPAPLPRLNRLDDFLQVLRRKRQLGCAGPRGESGPKPFERLPQPDGIDRLEHVVDGVDGKRLNRMLVEGGNKDQFWRCVGKEQPAGDFKAGQARHLHVEENDIGP